MRNNYSCENFRFWIEVNSIRFERKLENETAFDGIVKIYSLKTNNQILNKILEKKVFGDFFCATSHGIFLRMFRNKDSWPKTTLVYIDFMSMTFKEIQKTKSSWDVWTGYDLGNEKYSIAISPTETIEYQT